ncbi:MAG: 50S ribosomal protein L24 [Pseudomonadota bacterium]|nr:50S ribosomal protein L24 [Pseudomonadota bacterium]
MKKIKKSDKVIVLTGRSKGVIGEVLSVNGDKCVVSGVNIVKKHQKPNPNLGISGGIVEKEAAIHISNVALLNPNTNKADKVRIEIGEDGRKKRVFKSDSSAV